MFDPTEKLHELLHLLRQAEENACLADDPDGFDAVCVLYEQAMELEAACCFPRAALLRYIYFLVSCDRPEEALPYAREYAKLYGTGLLSEQASAAHVLGEVLLCAGSFGEAETELRRAKSLEAQLIASVPSRNCRNLGKICKLLGILFQCTGSYEAARTEYLQAMEWLTTLEEKASWALLAEQAEIWGRLGNVYEKMGRDDPAEAAYQRELYGLSALTNRSLHKLVNDAGSWCPCWEVLERRCSSLGYFYEDRGRNSEAEAAYLQCRIILEQIQAADPDAVLSTLPLAYGSLGRIQEKLGRLSDACGNYQAAADACKDLAVAAGISYELIPLATHYAQKAEELAD